MKQKLLALAVLVCSVLFSGIHAQTDIAIGNGTATNAGTTYPCPFQDYYQGSRAQYLYRASELIAAGMAPGSISSVKFNVTSIGSFTGTIEGYALRMANTTATTLTANSWETVPTTNLYGPVDYVPTSGINTLNLSTPFLWDGTSNIIVEVCNGQGTFTSNPLVTWTTGLSFNGSHTYRADGAGNLCGTSTTTNTGTQTTRPNIIFSYTPSASCTGAPNAGTTTSTSTNITCFNAPFTLGLTGNTVASGLTYQWQYSDNGTTGWTNIAGATTVTYTTSQTQASRYYRAIVTCTGSSQSANSTPVQVTSVGGPSYTTLPFQEQFETPWVNVCSTRDVPSTFWSNSPSTGNSSWRRDDDGTAAAWTSPTLGAYTPTGSNNTPHSARFHSYSSGTTTGDLNIYINTNTAVANKRLAFDYINTSGTDSLAVLISTDGGSTFTLYKSLKIAAEWTNQTVDFTTTSATTVVRFRALGGGTTDIGIDEINIFNLLNCTGTPTPGTTATSATTVCIGNTVSLSNTGATYGQAGITYQWQRSTDGGANWSDITGANGLVYNFTVASGYVTSSFRFVVKCSFSNSTVFSNVVQVALPAPTYRTLPYTEGFEAAWINSCDTRDIPNNSWRNTPFTGNNSWRREDDGDAGSWTVPNGGVYTPAGSNGSSHSARFHSAWATSGLIGNFDLYLNCNTGITAKRLTFDYINIDGTDSITILLSTDNGLTFIRLDSARTAAAWRTKTIVFNATSATTIVRFSARSDYGSSDIGLDNINLISFPDCTGTPAGGTASASQSSACIGSIIRLNLAGQTVNQNGLSYKWQQSTNGTTNWTDIPGATTVPYDYTVPSGFTTMYFRGVTTCTPSNSSANSTVIQLSVPLPTYLTLPMTQTFDSMWTSVCSTRDVPSAAGWRNNPFIGNLAWRREDDTTGGNWANMLGTPSSTGAMSTAHYARIHTYSVTTGNGALDVFLNCSSGPADKEVSFYYINPAGNDSLRVMLSTDGGTTFQPIGFRYGNNTDWDQKIIAFTSSSATTVIRFAAYAGSTTGTADIGIDQVNIKSVDCAQPPSITADINSPTPTQSTAVVKWRPVVNALAYEIAYSTSPTPPSYGDITGDTTYTYNNLTPVTQYYIFVRTLCFNGAYSSWYVYNFTTPCPSQTVPYFEGFESITANDQLPNCMAATNIGSNVYTYTTAQATYNRTPNTGSKFASFRYSTNTATNGSWIFTQPIRVTAGTNYDASFWYRTDGLSGWQIVGLYYGTSQDPAAMIKIDTLANRTNTEYLQFLRSVQFPTSGNIYLGIRVVANGTPWYLSVDDIELRIGAVVPVTLVKFTGEARGEINHLAWNTATELNNRGFEVERSEDGTKFSNIGYVASLAPNGNSNTQLDYGFDDKSPLQGVNYYRLKQIDKDGKVTYSSIVAVKSNRIYELRVASVYPNPTTSVLNVKVASPVRSKVQMIITDITGKQVYQSSEQLQQGETSLRINVASFSKGSYVVKMICNDGCNATPVKFIKQ